MKLFYIIFPLLISQLSFAFSRVNKNNLNVDVRLESQFYSGDENTASYISFGNIEISYERPRSKFNLLQLDAGLLYRPNYVDGWLDLFQEYRVSRKTSLRAGLLTLPLGYYRENVKTLHFYSLEVYKNYEPNMFSLFNSWGVARNNKDLNSNVNSISTDLGVIASHKYNREITLKAGVSGSGYLAFDVIDIALSNGGLNEDQYVSAMAGLEYKKNSHNLFANYLANYVQNGSQLQHFAGIGGKTSHPLNRDLNFSVRGESWYSRVQDRESYALSVYAFPSLIWKNKIQAGVFAQSIYSTGFESGGALTNVIAGLARDNPVTTDTKKSNLYQYAFQVRYNITNYLSFVGEKYYNKGSRGGQKTGWSGNLEAYLSF